MPRKFPPLEDTKPVHRGAKAVRAAHPNETVEILLRLRCCASEGDAELLEPELLRHVSHEEFERRYGARTEDICQIYEFAHEHGFSVTETDVGRRTVKLVGTVRACRPAFGVNLTHYQAEGFSYRGHEGLVHLPEHLVAVVDGVFGLNERPHLKPCVRALVSRKGRKNWHPFAVEELVRYYQFPSKYDGSGQCIALLEFGGGYRIEDLSRYFKGLGISMPVISSVGVGNARNCPGHGHPSPAEQEVTLDIEVAGSVAPGAKIAVYFARPGDTGFVDAFLRAMHDRVHKPTVISISWGMEESDWSLQALRVLNLLMREAGHLGITVCCASGDRGAHDGDGRTLHVNFPASSPYALACGGTQLRVGPQDSTEVVWNDGRYATGGGVSEVFGRPEWQHYWEELSRAQGNKPGRGLPDLAANADPHTGYELVVGGRRRILGGTSAVAPLIAGMIARTNQKLGGRVGYLTPTLYHHTSADIFNGILEGNNGAYRARPGWDACTGWGSPRGAQLMALLEQQLARAAAA